MIHISGTSSFESCTKMKNVTLFVFLALHIFVYGQSTVPEIKTYDDVVHIYLGGKKDRFPIAGLSGHFTADIRIPAVDTVGLISEMDSIAFVVGPQDTIDFNVVRLNMGDTLHCRFTFREEIRYASFTNGFKREHDGKMNVEVPKVYELVNILFSLTEAGRNNPGTVRKNTDYYDLVQSRFSRYSEHVAVGIFDSLLTNGKYLDTKMDAYAFEFNVDGKIVESPIYHILSWQDTNSILPFLATLNDFAAESGFLKFYGDRQQYYNDQYSTFMDTLQVDSMITWLKHNFPQTDYNSYKIVYSPLVDSNQSSWHWEDNDFKELQAHVNYPFPTAYYSKFKPGTREVVRGNIVFTELNHGFVNPETTRNNYGLIFREIFDDMSVWIDTDRPAGNYQNPFACFNEYLNWGLVSLRYYDTVPENELDGLQLEIEQMMVEHRGFVKFARFNQFLLEIYKNRAENQTIADLYPLIVSWFQINRA